MSTSEKFQSEPKQISSSLSLKLETTVIFYQIHVFLRLRQNVNFIVANAHYIMSITMENFF